MRPEGLSRTGSVRIEAAFAHRGCPLLAERRLLSGRESRDRAAVDPKQSLCARQLPGIQTGTPRHCISNLIASCAQPDTGGPFDEVSGR